MKKLLLTLITVGSLVAMSTQTHALSKEVFFDSVEDSLFHGNLSQDQADGMDAVLTVWNKYRADEDPRYLAYMLATTYHETSQEMQPIEEYGYGKGMSYGTPDPQTGQTYYGRGFVQLTWRDNYAHADNEIAVQFPGVNTNMEWQAHQALNPKVASAVMFLGMEEGWFRTRDGKPEILARYFSNTVNDPYTARGIINGDKSKVPSWSNGVSIGNLIKGYHNDFLYAIENAE
jgi:hypothetical protein